MPARNRRRRRRPPGHGPYVTKPPRQSRSNKMKHWNLYRQWLAYDNECEEFDLEHG